MAKDTKYNTLFRLPCQGPMLFRSAPGAAFVAEVFSQAREYLCLQGQKVCAIIVALRRGGRVVEGDRLLSGYRAYTSVAGSNPALSASCTLVCGGL